VGAVSVYQHTVDKTCKRKRLVLRNVQVYVTPFQSASLFRMAAQTMLWPVCWAAGESVDAGRRRDTGSTRWQHLIYLR